ncbi:hypothetical protein EVAR_68922_1 [Eumeta japonica]|uniref:Uncharacterized protein n=1 Tax=Eumeta variegata TaxID=151549 RepID=A0A4C2A912_EUMVA|nr:hypothetical protein EVAR_68922_1 [Eumeta japonica]
MILGRARLPLLVAVAKVPATMQFGGSGDVMFNEKMSRQADAADASIMRRRLTVECFYSLRAAYASEDGREFRNWFRQVIRRSSAGPFDRSQKYDHLNLRRRQEKTCVVLRQKRVPFKGETQVNASPEWENDVSFERRRSDRAALGERGRPLTGDDGRYSDALCRAARAAAPAPAAHGASLSSSTLVGHFADIPPGFVSIHHEET